MAKRTPPPATSTPGFDALSYWRLPKPSQDGAVIASLRQLAMELNCNKHANEPQTLDVERTIADMRKSVAISEVLGKASLGPWIYLSLTRLSRTTKFVRYGSSTYSYGVRHTAHLLPEPDWFDWTARAPHLGLALMRARKTLAAKALLASGCPPVLFLCQGINPDSLPTPEQAASTVMEMAATLSADACRFFYNALEASCSDPAPLRAALAAEARRALSGVWLAREGVANGAEGRALAQCAFAFDRLSKKKSLPNDLSPAVTLVAAKRATLGSDDDSGPAFEFSKDQVRRMDALRLLWSKDDLEAFAALAPLCGLDSTSAFESGVPASAGMEWPAGKYWSTRLAYQGAYGCCAHLLDAGDNPWLCAGDGGHGPVAAGNPFTWLASHGHSGHLEHFPDFASATVRAALRDAETRQPGNGLAACLEAFDESRTRYPKLWLDQGKGSAMALAACEQGLFPSMMAADAAGSPSQGTQTAPPQSRKARL